MKSSRIHILLLTSAARSPDWIAQAAEDAGIAIDLQSCDSLPDFQAALRGRSSAVVIVDAVPLQFDALLFLHQQHSEAIVVTLHPQASPGEIRALLTAGAAAVLSEPSSLQLATWLRIGAKQLALAGDRARLLGYKQSLQRLLQAVCDLSLARDLARVQQIVRSTARALNGADGATFVLRDGERCYYADEDAIEPLWKGQRFPLSACISGWAMLNRQPVAIEDIYIDSRIPIDAYRPTFVKSLVMVPIRTAEPIGAIGNYWAHQHLATAEEMELIQALADSTAIALENVQLYRELEQRVQQRTEQLEATNRELESFSYSVSHDLRAPLRQIDGLAEALDEDIGATLAEDSRAMLQSISASAKKMRTLIDDLLEFAQLGAKSLHHETIDMKAQARAVFAELSAQGPHHAELDLAELPESNGDAALLKQVWINLLSNGIKYSGKSAAPRLTVGYANSEREHVYFVRDNGAGFDQAHAKNLFGVFQRFHTDQEFPGTGVGLSIVHRVITRHGGRLWAESAPGAGATFYFSLPKQEEVRAAWLQ